MGVPTEEMENNPPLQMAGMTVRAPWTPESGRDPSSEELLNYFSQEQPQQSQPPETVNGFTAFGAPYTAHEPGVEPWSPESDRDPTSEELSSFFIKPEAPPPPAELTREERLRQLPGMLSPEDREARILGETPAVKPTNEPPPLPAPEIEPWSPETGTEPTPEQLREFTGIEASDTPMRATAVNPVNIPLRTDTDVGVIRSTLDNIVQGAATLMASVPKTVQLWFAPDTDLVGWMDEMDRLDADPEATKMQKVEHIVSGRQRFGTIVNVFTSGLVDAYIEGPKNNGDTLAMNRRKAKNQLMEELRKTVDKPLYRAGEAFDQVVRETFPTNPDLQDKWYSQVANGLGSVLGYMATFAITKKMAAPITPEVIAGSRTAAVVGGVGTAGLGITVQQSFAFEAALQGGAEIDTAFEAMYAGETLASGASEAIPISRFFTRADQATGGAIKKTLVRMMKQGTEEGLQEGFQQIMENLTAQRLYDPERNMWTGTTEPTALGFTTGALVEFLASMFVPGRIRGTTERGTTAAGEPTLDQQMAAAREAAGADPLDQAQAEAEVLAANADQLAETKARLQAQQEARAEGGVKEPLAGLIQAESDLARLPFEQRAEAVMQAVAEEVALAKTAAFEAVETERAAVKEAETQDAEVQKAAQETEVEEQVAKAVESQKVKPTTIGDIVTPEVRAGLEKMKAAKVAREAPVEPVEAPTPQLALTDQRADFAVTPAGEAIPKGTEEITIEAPALPGERPTKEAAAIIDAKANQAATSEANNIPMPTEAQLESGQYKKGELGPRDVGMPGVNVAVETPKGSTRRGTRPDGSQWSQKMRDHYGYIRGTESAEGPTEQLDAFIGDNMESDQIFVVDQVNDAGGFDEHKVMIGYANQMDAVRAYKRNNPQGKKVGPVTPMTKEQFTQWLERGDQTRPLSPKMREGQQVLAGEEEFQSLVARRQRQRGKKPVVRYRAEGLPMDKPARLKRAKQMGFDTDTVYYHGTDSSNIEAFQVGRKSKRYTTFSEREVESQGVFLTKSKDDALSYGENVAEYYIHPGRTFVPLDEIPSSSKDSTEYNKVAADLEYILEPVIYDVVLANRPTKAIDIEGGIQLLEIDDNGNWLNEVTKGGFEWDHLDNPEVVRRFKEKGYDSVVVAEPNDESGQSMFVFDPSNIRSVNAVFDPTETESSDLLLRAEGESAGVVQVRDAQAAIKPITKELKRLKPIIVASPDQLKDKTLLKALRAAGALKAKGVFYDGKLYIFASNHETSADVVRTLLHEGVAHQGLRALFKNEAELNDILDEVYSSMTEDQINSLRGKHRAYANIDLNTLEGQREMAEEHIAELAESDPQQTVIQQLIAKVRSMLRQAGLDVQWTNDDITNLLADARRELRKTIPLNRITVVSSVEVAETGEVIEVEEQADVALRQLTKRMNVIQQLRECQA